MKQEKKMFKMSIYEISLKILRTSENNVFSYQWIQKKLNVEFRQNRNKSMKNPKKKNEKIFQ